MGVLTCCVRHLFLPPCIHVVVQVNPCGAVHLTVGDAGNAEGLSWVEEQGLNTGNITARAYLPSSL